MGALVTYIGQAIGSKILASAVVKFIVNVAVAYAIAKVTAPTIPKGRLTGSQVTARSSLEFTKRVYGMTVVSGPIVYTNVSGTYGEYLWYVIALTDHQVDDISSIWFDGHNILSVYHDWDYYASPQGTGVITDPAYQDATNTYNAVSAWWYPGEATQAASQPLLDAGRHIDTDWTSAHQLKGCAYLVVRLLYDKNTEDVWTAGAPDNIKAQVKGCRVYDPRLDSTRVIDSTTSPETYGSGAHRLTDSTTWAWSENPALCVADYLTQVMDVAGTKIDWEAFADAADDCDVLVPIDNASPQNTELRFRCNGALSMGDSHQDNLQSILATMDGHLYWTQGKWTVRASVWKAPTVTITEDDIIGNVQVRGSAPKRDRYNLVRGFFVDPDRRWEAVEFPHITSATYQARDNAEIIPLDLKFPMVTSSTLAQRLAYRALNQGDNQKVIELPVSGKAAQLSVGDTVTLDIPTLGWTAGGNLLPYSEDFSTGWLPTNLTLTPASIATPSGKLNGTKFEITATAATNMIYYLPSAGSSQGHTLRILGHRGSGDNHVNAILLRNVTAADNVVGIQIDWSDGSFNFISGADDGNAKIRGVGAGWFEIILTAPGTFFADGDGVYVYVGVTGGTETAGEYAYFAEAMLIDGVNYSPIYQKTTGAAGTQQQLTARVTDWTFQQDGAIKLTLREDDATTYADPAGTDYSTANTSVFTELSDIVPPPENLTATAAANGIALNWTPPPAATYDFIEVYESLSDNWNDSPMPALVRKVRGSGTTLLRSSGFTGYYWVRAVREPDLQSLREPNSGITTVTATAGAASQASVIGATLSDIAASPDTAQCSYRMSSSTGYEQEFDETPSPQAYTNIHKFLEFGAPGDLECYMQHDSGTAPSGSAVDTWLALSSDRTWTLTQSVPTSPEAATTFSGTIKVRNAVTGEELDTAPVTMSSLVTGNAVAVSANTANVSLLGIGATCYAGVEFNSSGVEYRNASGTSTSFTSSRGDWLDVGASSAVWVERSLVSGTLNWQDPGAGRWQLSTSRQFGVSDAGPTAGATSCTVTFDFYDASSGGNLLDSVTITLTANYETGG